MPQMKAIIPLSPENLGGAFATADGDEFELLARDDKSALVEFTSLPSAVGWFGTHELTYCQVQHNGDTIKVIRVATGE